MGMMKNYLLRLLEQCSEEQFGQEAVEWAIFKGFVALTYKLEDDVRSIMVRYDEIIDSYRRYLADTMETMEEQTVDNQAPARAPMQRAISRRETEIEDSGKSLKRKSIA
jgi:hypothetical protein